MPLRALPGDWLVDEQARWKLLRGKREIRAIKWPKQAGARGEHVPSIMERLKAEEPPRSLLSPELEATWLWLEAESGGQPGLIVDQWMAIDATGALGAMLAYTAIKDRGGDDVQLARRMRARLSLEDESSWSRARATAATLAKKAKKDSATLLAYLFPEDDGRANELATKVKNPKGLEHLLILSTTEAGTALRLADAGAQAWGGLGIQHTVPSWLVVAMGEASRPALEQIGKSWPDQVRSQLAYLGGGQAPRSVPAAKIAPQRKAAPPSNALVSLLSAIEETLDDELRASLREPASEEAKNELATFFAGELPADLEAWFSWHDGQASASNGATGDDAFPEALHPDDEMTMLDIASALKERARLAADVDKQLPWSDAWLPVFENGGGDFYVYVMGGEQRGEIVEYRHDEPKRPVRTRSLTDLAREVKAAREENRKP